MNSKENLKRKINYSEKRVDWNNRDKKLLKEVKQVLLNWDSKGEKLIRITTTSTGNKLNKLSLIQKHLNKMPKTPNLILASTETAEEFQLRRLVKARNDLIIEGVLINTSNLMRKVGLRKGNVSENVMKQVKCITLNESF